MFMQIRQLMLSLTGLSLDISFSSHFVNFKKFLVNNSSLTELGLRRLGSGVDRNIYSIRPLFKGIRLSKRIESLSLSYKGEKDVAFLDCLYEAYIQNHNLKEMRISNQTQNQIRSNGNAGGRSFKRSFRMHFEKNRSLTYLDISFDKLEIKEFKKFSQATSRNTGLLRLDLASDITDGELLALSELLTMNSNLVCLSLSNSIVFSEVLKQRFLVMSFNDQVMTEFISHVKISEFERLNARCV
jgi:hypothetical protein